MIILNKSLIATMNTNDIFIIAEVGQAHDGSLGIAHSFIDALKETGVDAVKFQVHIAHAESSMHEQFRLKFSYEDSTRYDYWKRMEFSEEEWAGLKDHCEKIGLEFMASCFSNEAVDLLGRLQVRRFKVGSGEVTNHLMLNKIASYSKPVILSSGMSSFGELDSAVDLLKSRNCDLSILQCTTAYPVKPEEWGLNVLDELRNRYNVPVGLSDHSGEIYASLAAAALGADIIEFHVAFDKRMFGPDSPASLTISQTTKVVQGIRTIRQSLLNPVNKNDISKFAELKTIFEKSLSINRNMKAGTIITIDMLEAKKPKGYGIPASEYESVLGRKLKEDMNAWDFLNYEDLQ